MAIPNLINKQNKNMKKSYYVLAAVLGLMITTAAVSVATLASGPNFDPADRAEHRQEMQQIFTNGDYDTWKANLEERVAEMRARADQLEASISQETFAGMQQMHQLIQDGDLDGAKALAGELGLPGPGPMGGLMHHGFHGGWQVDKSQ